MKNASFFFILMLCVSCKSTSNRFVIKQCAIEEFGLVTLFTDGMILEDWKRSSLVIDDEGVLNKSVILPFALDGSDFNFIEIQSNVIQLFSREYGSYRFEIYDESCFNATVKIINKWSLGIKK
jgi:hypothetical protein